MATDFSEQQAELRRLAAERDAVLLAHNYQRPEVQDAADFVGDSLELSRKAAATAEQRHPLLRRPLHGRDGASSSPQKTVLMPDLRAGCPMANMVTRREAQGAQGAAPRALPS